MFSNSFRRKTLPRLLWCSAALLTSCASPRASISLRAATLSSETPGNVFVEKQPLRFSVNDAHGAVSLSLRDYAGREVWTGSGAPSVSIPAQPPGWYELAARDESGENKVSLGVLFDRKNVPLPAAGRVNADAASAWIVGDDATRRTLAHLTRLAGIPRVRERMSWSANEPQRGKIAWAKPYEDTAATWAAEGIRVDEIWHDTPEWTRPERAAFSLAPDDLRDVYRFTRAAASHYAAVDSWEVWNEPDYDFWKDASDRLAGLQKAAYFGLKDGNPRTLVLNGAFAMPSPNFVRHFFENGSGDYADLYAWHRYADPQLYPGDLQNHRAEVRESGAPAKPWWMTEAGIMLYRASSTASPLLSDAQQKEQARFVPRSIAMSLAAGDDKHFFFVLPNFPPDNIQYGSLKPDMTPYPSFVALSAAANLLGLSDYAGTVAASAGITAQAFDTKNGRIVVAWSAAPQTLSLPARGAVTVRDMFGAVASTRAANNGSVSVEVGPDAVYISGATPQVTPPAPGVLPPSVLKPAAPRVLAKAPSRLVVMGYAALPLNKDRDAYVLGKIAPNATIPYTVEAYNFDEKTARSGEIAVQAPAGWSVSPAKQNVTLAPMDRRVLAFTLTPSAQRGLEGSVRAVATFAGQKVAPSVSHFLSDPTDLTPLRTQPLDWTNPALWNATTSPAGTSTVSRTTEGALHIAATFDKPGDRWAYPAQSFATPPNFSAYDGIAFDLKTAANAPNSVVRLMLTERGGAVYLSAGLPADGTTRRVVILFRDLNWGSFSPPDPNHKLDLDQITGVQLGLNTPGDAMSFEASHFALVKFAGVE